MTVSYCRITMKAFIGYHCSECGAGFDVDSRSLRQQDIDHADPEYLVCGCDDKIRRVYKDVEEETLC